jgi:uncharacterized paraquat-inducible protein A
MAKLVKCERCETETAKPYLSDEGETLCPRCYPGPTFAGAHEDEPTLPPRLFNCVRF